MSNWAYPFSQFLPAIDRRVRGLRMWILTRKSRVLRRQTARDEACLGLSVDARILQTRYCFTQVGVLFESQQKSFSFVFKESSARDADGAESDSDGADSTFSDISSDSVPKRDRIRNKIRRVKTRLTPHYSSGRFTSRNQGDSDVETIGMSSNRKT